MRLGSLGKVTPENNGKQKMKDKFYPRRFLPMSSGLVKGNCKEVPFQFQSIRLNIS